VCLYNFRVKLQQFQLIFEPNTSPKKKSTKQKCKWGWDFGKLPFATPKPLSINLFMELVTNRRVGGETISFYFPSAWPLTRGRRHSTTSASRCRLSTCFPWTTAPPLSRAMLGERDPHVNFFYNITTCLHVHTQGKLQLKTKLRSVFGISILDCISHTLNFDLSAVITRIYWALFHVCKKWLQR
jgi:hypothetical protein